VVGAVISFLFFGRIHPFFLTHFPRPVFAFGCFQSLFCLWSRELLDSGFEEYRMGFVASPPYGAWRPLGPGPSLISASEVFGNFVLSLLLRPGDVLPQVLWGVLGFFSFWLPSSLLLLFPRFCPYMHLCSVFFFRWFVPLVVLSWAFFSSFLPSPLFFFFFFSEGPLLFILPSRPPILTIDRIPPRSLDSGVCRNFSFFSFCGRDFCFQIPPLFFWLDLSLVRGRKISFLSFVGRCVTLP